MPYLHDSQLHMAKIIYAAKHVPMLVPRLDLIKAGHTLGLSPAMGFLNENDSFAYFAILRELSSGLTFIGFSRLSIFSQY